MVSPDDLCAVCNEIRENHGDRQHEFNMEGVLIPKKKPEPARQQPPRERTEPAPAQKGVEEIEKSHLRLVELLIDKGVLDAKDTVYILGGPST